MFGIFFFPFIFFLLLVRTKKTNLAMDPFCIRFLRLLLIIYEQSINQGVDLLNPSMHKLKRDTFPWIKLYSCSCLFCATEGHTDEDNPVSVIKLEFGETSHLYTLEEYGPLLVRQDIAFLSLSFTHSYCQLFMCNTCYQELTNLIKDWKAQILPSLYWDSFLLSSFHKLVGDNTYECYLSIYQDHLKILLQHITNHVKDVADLILQYSLHLDFCEVMQMVKNSHALHGFEKKNFFLY